MNNRYLCNKEILKYLPNYYNIADACFKSSDDISYKLISIYEEYIFSIDITNKEDCIRAKSIDKLMNRYLIDFEFRKEIVSNLSRIKVKKSEDNIVLGIVKGLINLYDKYLDEYTKIIYIPKWI
ncbi:MAG: hypothetical protein RR228_01930 [Bacilli bacterium]